MIQAIDFIFSPPNGVITETQFNVHKSIYKGYVDKINEIDLLGNVPPNFFRGVKKDETYSLNGVILHEMYFQNIAKDARISQVTAPTWQAAELMDKLHIQYNTLDTWKKDFEATAKSSRGWVILTYDARSKRFRNISLDLHDEGFITGMMPLIICDVYEHAYYIDYQSNKTLYVSNFLKAIDWEVVGRRYQKLF